MPDINTDPASSNIYGISERILLTWLNYCYSNYREQVWAHREQCKENSKKKDIDSNFLNKKSRRSGEKKETFFEDDQNVFVLFKNNRT
jgi:hypothetical protein